MNIFLINGDSPHASSLMKKLSEETMDGAIINLTTQEMDLYFSPEFQHVHINGDVNHKIVELKDSGSSKYVFLMDDRKDNIDDAIRTISELGLNAGIIRSGKI
jgi:hypothetical protein